MHEGAAPKDALALMRSKYSAYALHLSSYIIQTTHTSSSQYEKDILIWKMSIEEFSTSTTFAGHTIIEAMPTIVTFHAKLLQGRKDVSFSEKSFFQEEGGKLKYFQGSRV